MRRAVYILIIFLSGWFSAKAQIFIKETAVADTVKRPLKLGLALSGGGVKGMAQIPVLEELEKRKIPVSYITGTSIGSVVGGLYAMGYTAAQIKEIFFDINWEHALTDNISRKELAMYLKPLKDRLVVKLNFDKEGIYWPSGIVWGYNINKIISRYTYKATTVTDFNKLHIPFACVATDLETGEKKVFRSGSLADAIRASMSISSIFTPWEVEGRYYVDGGLVANNPVQEAFDMGADIVLAVDISSRLKNIQDLNNLFNVMEQSITFSMAKVSAMDLRKTKYVIRPDVREFGPLDFGKTDIIYQRGKTAVEQADGIFEELAALTDTASFIRNRGIELPGKLKIKELQAEGNRISEKELFFHFEMNKPDSISIKRLENKIDRLYGKGFNSKIVYRLEELPHGDFKLILKCTPQKRNILGFSNSYDSYYGARWLFTLIYNNLFKRNFMVISDFMLGTAPAINVGIMKRSPYIHSMGGLLLCYDSDKNRIFEGDKEIIKYRTENIGAKLFWAYFVKNIAMIQVYGGAMHKSYHSLIGAESLGWNYRLYGVGGTKLVIDQLNDKYFPTSGYALYGEVKYFVNEEKQGYFAEGNLSWNLYGNYFRDHVIFHTVKLGSNFLAPLDEPHFFPVGGYESFLGYEMYQMQVRNYALETLGYRYKLNRYLYLRTEVQWIKTTLKNEWFDISIKNIDASINVSLLTKLPFTTGELTVSHSNVRNLLVWFKFGYDLSFPL